MANMSYCRFQNTASDLADCLEHIEDDLSEDEHRARKHLLILCAKALLNADVDLEAEDIVKEVKRAAAELPVAA